MSSQIAAFAVLYGIFLSFGELGPGNCLGLLASKLGPTAVRGQFYGTAAAIGKVGAFVGVWAFPPMIEAFGGSDSAKGNTGPFWVGSGLAILSALITFFMVRPLEADAMKVEEENVSRELYRLLSIKLNFSTFKTQFRTYLAENGWDVSQMGLKGDDIGEGSSASGEIEKQGAVAV